MVLTKHTRVLTLNDMERLERTLFRLEQGRPGSRYAFYIYLVGTSYTLCHGRAKCTEKYCNLCCTFGAKKRSSHQFAHRYAVCAWGQEGFSDLNAFISLRLCFQRGCLQMYAGGLCQNTVYLCHLPKCHGEKVAIYSPVTGTVLSVVSAVVSAWGCGH